MSKLNPIKDLIAKARELFAKNTMMGAYIRAQEIIPELCNALEQAQFDVEMNERLYETACAERDMVVSENEQLRNAIKIKGGDEHYPTEDAYLSTCKALDKAHAEIEKMKPFYKVADDTFKHWENAAYAMRDEERKRHRWIPVTEELPKEREDSQDIYHPITLGFLDTEYFMVSDLVNVVVLNHDSGDRFVCDDITVNGKWVNYTGDFEVTHWRSIPKLPKEGE